MKSIFQEINLPIIQNRIYKNRVKALNAPIGKIRLDYDNTYGIVINDCFEEEKVNYGPDYDNEQSLSDYFKLHLENVTRILEPYLINSQKIVEIGCGKGSFMDILTQKGFKVIGCDPAYNGTNPNIIKERFGFRQDLKGDFIILRHVLEHIPNPVDFLREISKLNDGQGYIYIEVPDFNWILQNNVFFDIFYEHCNYFRPIDFENIFENIVDAGPLFNGQYQYVIADLSKIRVDNKNKYETLESSLDLTGLQNLINVLKQYHDSEIWIWGAASKGIVLNIYLLNEGINVKGLIDINSNKHGGYTPIVANQVYPPSILSSGGKANVILVMNPNYFLEVQSYSTNKNDHFINVNEYLLMEGSKEKDY